MIDVLRAFTTAAYAFARDAEKIYPVADVSEALTIANDETEPLSWVR